MVFLVALSVFASLYFFFAAVARQLEHKSALMMINLVVCTSFIVLAIYSIKLWS